jgi:cation:H+ antiporter
VGLETPFAVAQLLFGTLILFWGSEWLVRGSATLARTLGVKSLVIGLTVVAYGTSAPELAVSTEAATGHLTPVALGNVIGACAANISLILGLTALIAPPTVDSRIIKREVPILLLSVVAIPFTLWDGVITRTEGIVMVACAVVFTIVTLTVSSAYDASDDDLGLVERSETAAAAYGAPRRAATGSRTIALLMSGIGVLLLVVGSSQFVAGARQLAGQWGISERMLGMTIVALGTSMPELIASVMAARRGEGSLAVGSVIGSNLLNVFLVLGMVAYLHPVRVGERMHLVDAIGLAAITLLAVTFLRGSRRVTRLEGAILVAAYLAFMTVAAIL